MRFGRFGADATLEWKATLQKTLRELEGFDTTRLKPRQRGEHSSLASWIRTELVLLESLGGDHRDPLTWVDRVDRTLEAVLVTPKLGGADRALEVGNLLEALPAYWESAISELSLPSREWSAEAKERVDELRHRMRFQIPDALKQVKIPPAMFEIALERLETADDVTLEFQEWLSGSPVQAGGAIVPFVEGAWEALMQDASGIELTALELKSRLLIDIAEADLRWIDGEAAELKVGEINRRVSQASAEAIAFATGAELIGPLLPWKTKVVPRITRSRHLPCVPVRLRSAAGGYGIDLEPPGLVWPEEIAATRSRLFSPASQRAIGIRFGFPGESLMILKTGRGSRRDSSAIRTRITDEGWGLYVLDWLPRVSWVENPYAKDEALKAAAAYHLLLEASRLVACIELHHEGMLVEDVVDTFAYRTGFDQTSALQEIRRIQRDPLLGIGYLGYLELLENERVLRGEASAPIALLNAIETVLRNPELRPSDMRGNLFVFRAPDIEELVIEEPEIGEPEIEEPEEEATEPGEDR